MDKALYAYARDLIGEGYDAALGRLRDAGVNAVTLAAGYRAGKSLPPRRRRQGVRPGSAVEPAGDFG